MVRLKCLLFEETLARVLRACKKITFCFTGAINVLLTAVVRRPRSALNPGFFSGHKNNGGGGGRGGPSGPSPGSATVVLPSCKGFRNLNKFGS